MSDSELTYRITLNEACKLISKETGKPVTPETHWIKASIELTEKVGPLAVVKLEAFKR